MINLIKSTFFNEESTKDALCQFIQESKRLSMDEQCFLFEEQFAKWQGRQHCVFFNSGSSANLALIQALLNLKRLKLGARIGVSAVTWATNVMPIIQLGCVPVLIDVELETLNVSSKTLAQSLQKEKLDAFFITHLLGFCDNLDEIKKICDDQKILLLEDNCESLGTVYQGKKLGSFGIASTFSTYVGHHLSTIEGGMVCTDDEELTTMLIMVRAHGWDRNLPADKRDAIRKKYGSAGSFLSSYTFYAQGYNLRPTEISGFLGNHQLPLLEKTLQAREKNFRFFSRLYEQKDLFYPIVVTHLDFVSNFAVPVLCRTHDIFRKLADKMQKAEIEIRPIVGGYIAHQPFFKDLYPGRDDDCPNAALIEKNGFYFGNNEELTIQEKDYIIQTLCSEKNHEPL